MSQQVYSVKVEGRVVAKFRADLAQASAAVEVRGDGEWVGTQWQTASGSHDAVTLAALVLSGDPDTANGDEYTVECDGAEIGTGRIGDGWYEFRASNSQTHYGFGSETQAKAYADKLNASREINCYAHIYLAADDAVANEQAGCDLVEAGVMLAAELVV